MHMVQVTDMVDARFGKGTVTISHNESKVTSMRQDKNKDTRG